MELEQRFWKKVDKEGPVPDVEGVDTGCWLWTAGLGAEKGYGYFRFKGVMSRAHMLTYEESYGAVPEGWHVHHLCEVRICVRPDHLEALSPKEHAAKGNQILKEGGRCLLGRHEVSVVGVQKRSDGSSVCAGCRAEAGHPGTGKSRFKVDVEKRRRILEEAEKELWWLDLALEGRFRGVQGIRQRRHRVRSEMVKRRRRLEFHMKKAAEVA